MLLSYLPLNHGLRTPNEDFFHRYPLFMFSINQPLFLQKYKPLYPNIYLGLGFEFGPQRIRDLAIVCP